MLVGAHKGLKRVPTQFLSRLRLSDPTIPLWKFRTISYPRCIKITKYFKSVHSISLYCYKIFLCGTKIEIIVIYIYGQDNTVRVKYSAKFGRH